MTIGDVLVDESHAVYLVTGIGFSLLPKPRGAVHRPTAADRRRWRPRSSMSIEIKAVFWCVDVCAPASFGRSDLFFVARWNEID
jgi:hypothetical protein